MNGGHEIADAGEGGHSARAGGSDRGDAPSADHRAPDRCANCGAMLAGAYCHDCGQQAEVHRTLGAFWHDLLHGVLHFEGKIWRTLPMLAWKPGELTRRYIAGERAKFVSPLALFLFSVFTMFAVFSLVGGPMGVGSGQAGQGGTTVESTAGADEAMAELDAELGDVPAMLDWVGDSYAAARENPALLAYKLQTNAYKFSWALIPISAPFLWLLFLHRRRYRQFGGYDHVVFVTYSIAFMSLGLIALSLLRPFGAGGALTALAITCIPPLHMYRQLRGAYGLSRWSAGWRSFLLVTFAFIAVTLFLSLLLALGG